MCGIVGYIGTRACLSMLIEGLRKLEYRGYDSAGLAVIDTEPVSRHEPAQMNMLRVVGKLAKLDEIAAERPLQGNVGIGHTRWATHGRPTQENAHPHLVGDVALVHNGIFENHIELRKQLQKQGRVFASETDTEIAAHLIDVELTQGASSLFEATSRALSKVRGAYAIAVVSHREPNVIVIAKNCSPLVLGVGHNEMWAASDVPALLSHTREVIFLEDGDIAEIKATGFRIEHYRQPVTRAIHHIHWSPIQAEKQGYKHFMLKEIFEQPVAIENTLRGRVLLDDADVSSDEIGVSPNAIATAQRIVLLACGTSYHAALAGRVWFESIAKIPTQVELASEFRYREPLLNKNDFVIAVSQSGETIDTLLALREAKRQGACTLALVNVVGSAIARTADGALYTHAGPEIGVASTKCFTTQLAALFMLSVYAGRRRNALDQEHAQELLQQLVEVPMHMHQVLEDTKMYQQIARRQLVSTHARDCLFLGRGLSVSIALEGALKLKELSYIHAEGYAAGEMKHGPIALIDSQMPVIVVAPKDHQYEKIVSNVQEVRAREGRVIAIVTKGDTLLPTLAQEVIELPAIDELLTPFLTVIPLQLLSYYTADLRGNDVDQPRNLAKTVTVE